MVATTDRPGASRAFQLDQTPDGVTGRLVELNEAKPKEGEVAVRIAYSSLNYKDALAVTNRGKIIRSFPMTPGIDLAGVVEESAHPDFGPGQQVFSTGWGLGERYPGGFAQRVVVKGAWLLPVPPPLDLRRTMALGTAGFTAMLAVRAIEEHAVSRPEEASVVVTGASGGVGVISLALLSRLGYRAIASTGKVAESEFLRAVGAAEVISRESLLTSPEKPLEAERWDAGIDSVGGATLAGLLRKLKYRASVAACGLAGGTDLPTTVFPFILRGVNLLGIDSVMCPQERRREAWTRLAQLLPAETLDMVSHVIPLSEITEWSQQLLAGNLRGRAIVDVNA